MSNSIYALILTFIAGLSTLVGAFFVLFRKRKDKFNFVYILGFTIGILSFLVIFHLIPESYDFLKKSVSYYKILLPITILIGIVLIYLLDILFDHDKEKNLYHVGILTSLSVSLHKLPEAISLFLISYTDLKLGLLLTLAIVLHHIPEGIMIASPIYQDTNNKWKALKFTILSSIVSPIGGILMLLFSKCLSNNIVLGLLLGISSGMFIFLIVRELIPTTLKYKQNKKALIAFIFGFLFMYVCHLLI